MDAMDKDFVGATTSDQPFWMHSRAWLISKKSGKYQEIFRYTFSQEATIQLGKDWKECVC